MEDTVVAFIVFGGPGLVLGAGAAYFLATTPARGLAVVVTGVGVVVALALASAFSTDPNACHDCEEWYGGAFSLPTIVFVVGNALGWILGSAVGTVLRQARRRPSAQR